MDLELTTMQVVALVLLVSWEFVWKGLALWRAARRQQPYWFVAILIINSLGILPIFYLLFTSRKAAVAAEQNPQGV